MIHRHKNFTALLIGVALVAIASVAHAHGYTLGNIGIAHPYSLPTPAGATTGGGYIRELSNKGAADDRLVGASSPAADHVELHTMSMDGDVMRMRQVPGIVIPAGGHVDMAPGNGYHLMMIGIKQPLKVGDKVPVKLTFEKAGTVDVELLVQERGAATGMRMN
jgi:periplasmic copper chaperone A